MVIQSPCGLIEYMQATLSSTANNVTGDGTFYKVVFNNVAYDTASGYNAGTGVYTAQRSGVYLAVTNIGFAGVTDPAFDEYLIDITMGTEQWEDYGNPYVQVAPSGILVKVVSGLTYLTAGQTIDVDIQVSGGALTVDANGGSSLSICLIREFT